MRSKRVMAALLLLACIGAAAEAEAQRTPEQRARREVVRRGWLGISFRILEEGSGRNAGGVVTDVFPQSPADRAGVQEGDTVVRWNGRSDIKAALEGDAVEPGDSVRLRLRRGGRERDVTVVAAVRPPGVALRVPHPRGDVHFFGPRELRLRMDSLRVHADSLHRHLRAMWRDSLGSRLRVLEPGRLRGNVLPGEPVPLAFDLELGMRGVAGAEFAEMNPGLAGYFGTERGALVLRVAPETPAARAGLQAGDVVVEIDDEPVEGVRDLRRAIARARGRTLEMEVVRKGRRHEIRMSWER